MPRLPRVDVIMPTLATRQRAAGLRRAIRSVLGQRDVRGSALVVMNGEQCDRDLIAELARTAGVRVIRCAEADLPLALTAGRACVATDWFAELDDDDELMPDALAMRLEAARGAADIDAVISNGYVLENGTRRLHVPHWSQVEGDPLRALLDGNWLRPGAGLFRSAAVTQDDFAGMPRYLERTYMALRLAIRGRLRFLESPTFLYRADTPESDSKSRACQEGQPQALERLLQLDLPAELERTLRWRRTVACNGLAMTRLREGDLRAAWRWHLRTLRGHRGWRFALNARRLLFASIVPARAKA